MRNFVAFRHIHGEGLGRRWSYFLVFGGSVFVIVLFKNICKLWSTYQAKKKIQQRQLERQLGLKALEDHLSEYGLTVDERAEIIALPFKEVRDQLQMGQLSARAVLRAYQSRAVEINKSLNCIVEPIWEAEALSTACDMSSRKKGPLHGIPVSIKENFYIKGYDSTGGLSYFLGKPQSEDAVLVQVLKQQGAVPFMRTNIPQTMISGECANPIYGITNNPADLSRSPGGSSGGEAAMLAAEGSILGIGSDIGGSIRIPSSACGVCGLKCTIDRLSGKGKVQPVKGQTLIPAAVGPLARDVDTLVIAMKALLVPLMSQLDPTIPLMPFNNEVYESVRPLRIGYYVDNGIFQSVPASQRAVLLAKTVLQHRGHTFVPFEPPKMLHAASYLYVKALFGDGGRQLKSYLDNDVVDSVIRKLYLMLKMPTTLKCIMSKLISLKDVVMGKALWNVRGVQSVAEWWELTHEFQEYRDLFIGRWRELELDALISPGYACPALPYGYFSKVQGVVSYTALYNVVDFPAGSLPVTKVTAEDEENMAQYHPTQIAESFVKQGMVGSTGLPVNVQCVALPFQEELVLRLMKEIEMGLHD